MKIIPLQDYQEELKFQSSIDDTSIDDIVRTIIANVRKKGDAALLSYTEKFDHIRIDNMIVQQKEIDDALQIVDKTLYNALEEAKKRIVTYHEAQKEYSWFMNQPGIMLGQKVSPLDRVGIYVPGGKAVYPSTVLMNVLPAKIAGVENIHIVTPPQPDGTIHPNVLVAAHLAGVDSIYKVGGAQGIAALAYGTETIPKVDKIVGPGNQFVARAKKWVYGDVAIDMIAGPSEICVIADESVAPSFVAADLLSQAEHDEEAKTICITTSKEVALKIQSAVRKQMASATRKSIIQASIQRYGRIIVTETMDEAIRLANRIAPEHLQLMTEKASEHMHGITHAGAIFLGPYSPEPLGDYMAGPNHTLPTNGTATFASPLGVYDFVKKSSIIQYSKEALQRVADDIITIATHEQLDAHATSIQLRKEEK